MALIREGVCLQCRSKYCDTTPLGHPNERLCPKCKQAKNDARRKAHFDHLDTLTTEERLRRVEEWIYDYKPPVNSRDVFF